MASSLPTKSAGQVPKATMLYENYLKGEYVYLNGDDALIITARSCFRARQEAAWLIDHLPREGTQDHYVRTMAELGILDARKIFDRLILIGALRSKPRHSVYQRALQMLLAPTMCLMPARWQEKALHWIGYQPARPWVSVFPVQAIFPLLALIIEIAVHTNGNWAILESMSSGTSNTVLVFCLLLLGSLVHELGHSLAAAESGIGLRPIGFALYLFFPVFYSNVSGMENLPLSKKVAIDCGGIVLQSGYIVLLGILWALGQNICLLEAIQWMGFVMFFNLNPLLRTDAYWLYHDVRTGLRPKKILIFFHWLYLIGFSVYTVYLFYLVFNGITPIVLAMYAEIHHPLWLLTHAYPFLLGAYVSILVFSGGIKRLQEGRQEWLAFWKPRSSVE